ARKRGFVLGNQDYDGMSRISGLITPELRALFEALLAALAAPGTPDPTADPDHAAGSDTRSSGQRNHDALITAIRALFASEQLGSHRGLPVTM
ncbi:hypothetical protein BST16_28085, partial [Mycobacterium asiaticum DSM 44297]|uniref:DUF222 domain-containing protein n=1 Tax=Mycobacterium asiaticum TaxID=1790 RepID=UPI000A0D3591